MNHTEKNKKIAILIDAENVSYKNTKQIIETMVDKGDVIIKVIITDWSRITKSKLTGKEGKNLVLREKQIDGWRKEASIYSMTAVQQFTYVQGKNSSDIALAIEALKILYEKPFIDLFCIVSNDSDFTKLAQVLREQNKEVVGMGERNKAIPEFVNAFTEFVYLGEALDEKESKPKPKKTVKKTPDETVEKVEPAPVQEEGPVCPLDAEKLAVLKEVIQNVIENKGVAHYSAVYDDMKKKHPDFVPANYGFKSLSTLMSSLLPFLPEYQKKEEKQKNNPNAVTLMLIKNDQFTQNTERQNQKKRRS